MLQNDYEEFPEIISLIEMYEWRQDKESQLVYMLDKFLPIANSFHAGDRYFFDKNITFTKWKAWLDTKLPPETIAPEFSSLYKASIQQVSHMYSQILSKEDA